MKIEITHPQPNQSPSSRRRFSFLRVIRTMHKKGRIILIGASLLLVAGIVLALGGCSAIMQHTSARQVPLCYFGQISVGVPVVEQSSVVVPLTLSEAPPINSALAPYRIKAHISGNEIDMTIVTALVGDGSLKKDQLVLSDVSPGDYTVFYRDPDGTRHKLSQITIPKP